MTRNCNCLRIACYSRSLWPTGTGYPGDRQFNVFLSKTLFFQNGGFTARRFQIMDVAIKDVGFIFCRFDFSFLMFSSTMLMFSIKDRPATSTFFSAEMSSTKMSKISKFVFVSSADVLFKRLDVSFQKFDVIFQRLFRFRFRPFAYCA